jgi:hypothetical protein
VFLIEPFIMLGKASLQVFCAHLAFVFVGLALLYGTVSQLHGFHAVGLVALTFVGLIFVALRKIRRERLVQTTTRTELKIDPASHIHLGLAGDKQRLESNTKNLPSGNSQPHLSQVSSSTSINHVRYAAPSRAFLQRSIAPSCA